MKAIIYLVVVVSLIGVSTGCVSNERTERFQRLEQVIQQSTPEQRADRQTERLADALNLTDEQILGIQQINLDFHAGLQEVVESSRRTRAKGRQIKNLVSKRNESMQTILSTDQFEQFLLLQEQSRNWLQQSL